MNVVPFRKPNDKMNSRPVTAQNDDFSREVEITRANQALMGVLKARAKAPATLSLEDVKKLIEIEPD
jgi:hypothetical protein